MGKILVTPRSATATPHPSLERFKAAGHEVVFATPGKQPTEEELLQVLPGCVGYLAGVEKISARVLEAAVALKVISRNGVGIDNIDLAAAEKQGIAVCKALGANSRGVAELTMAHILSLVRWVPFSDQAIKAGGWERRKGGELCCKTLGLLGCGNIGKLVAKAAFGFNMKVLAYDVMPDSSFKPEGEFSFASLDEVLRQSDVISLHCPALPDGKPLLDTAALACMKKGVFIVNTARAELIDDEALAAALESGQVAGAALDVFKVEPPTEDPLVKRDRIVATPHIGGYTKESVDRAMQQAIDNVLSELGKGG